MALLKLLLTAVFWGGTFIAGRLLAGEVPPLVCAFLRFAAASVLLVMFLWMRHGRLPALPRSVWKYVLLMGLTGVFAYNLFFFWGLEHVEAGRAATIIALNPVAIAVGAALLLGHRLGPFNTLGVAVSVSGAVLAVSRGDLSALFAGGLGLGDVLILGCVISWASFSLLGATTLSSIPPLTSITYAAMAGTVMLLPFALHQGMPADIATYGAGDWASIAFLAVLGTAVGFVWYYEGIDEIGPTHAGLFINFVPISAIVLAYIMLSEPITWSLAGGATLVITGVYLAINGWSLPWKPQAGVAKSERHKIAGPA